ncbi:MAG: hypothetical protein ACRDD7_17565 [Peptostreptococcaceae bacterium]
MIIINNKEFTTLKEFNNYITTLKTLADVRGTLKDFDTFMLKDVARDLGATVEQLKGKKTKVQMFKIITELNNYR